MSSTNGSPVPNQTNPIETSNQLSKAAMEFIELLPDLSYVLK